MQIITAQQILLPKKVYIGDMAELRCTFNSPDSALKSLTSQGTAALSTASFDSEASDYVIKDVTLSPAGVDYYQLTISFVPWKTGDLQFPPMTIEGSNLILEFQPVQIVSLISNDSSGTATLHDSAAPLLLPGTAYKLYGALAAFILLLIILIRIIVKRKSLLFYINQKRLLKRYKKNKKRTIKLLNQLAKKTADAAAAEEIQKIMRSYLEVRFDYPFTRTVTSELMKGWHSVTGDLLSDSKEDAFGEIAAAFIRTDYIRYSKRGAFKEGELGELIKKLSDCIEILESQGEAHA